MEDGVTYKTTFVLASTQTGTCSLAIGVGVATAGGTVIALGAQIETGAFHNGFIETTGAAITRSTSVSNQVDNYSLTLVNQSFLDYPNLPNSVLIKRNMPPTAEDGGYLTYTTSGDMTSKNYLHNDHTTEVWFKPIDRSPTAYDSSEGQNSIVVYRGFHSMWYYSETSYRYNIWGQTSGTNNSYSLAINDSEEGQWTQLVATRSGNTLSLYKNGEFKTSGTISAGTDGIPTSNDLRIGAANYNGSFAWHANMEFASLKMYKKALTEFEVQQNFNALRRRFGL